MPFNPLLGVWKLKSWSLTDKQGNKQFPMGEDAAGYIIYTDVGLMSVHLSKAKRTQFQSSSIFEPTLDEALQSYQEHISYAGPYDIVAENKVLHHISLNTYPNWIGGVQERTFEIKGNQLHISNPLEQWQADLVWEKQV